ncbi:hypothetical protein GQX74_014828 [Glossina fuscipes]|nr:hypothetical protein GQX74_014828 [Glossina fuscipes]
MVIFVTPSSGISALIRLLNISTVVLTVKRNRSTTFFTEMTTGSFTDCMSQIPSGTSSRFSLLFISSLLDEADETGEFKSSSWEDNCKHKARYAIVLINIYHIFALPVVSLGKNSCYFDQQPK